MINLQELAILPGSGCAVLCNVKEDQISTLQELDFSYSDPHLIGGNNWIVALEIPDKYKTYGYSREEKSIQLHPIVYRAKLSDCGKVEQKEKIELTNLVLNKSMALYGNILFIGAYRVIPHPNKTRKEEWGDEVAGFIDLSEDRPKWSPILPPNEECRGNLKVLQIGENRLWLINDLESKDLILEYNVSAPASPVFIRSFSAAIPKFNSVHGFRSARDWRMSIDRNWLAVHEVYSDNHSTTNSINVYQLPDLKKALCVSNTRHDGFDSTFDDDRRPFDLKRELAEARGNINMIDFNFTSTELLVACNHHGLTAFPLDAALEYCRLEQEQEAQEMKTRKGTRFYSEPGMCKGIENAIAEHQKMPAELATVDRLVPLHDGRVVAVSPGETGGQLVYKLLP